MPIKIPCGCGRRLNVADTLAGKRVRCPNCKLVHDVPGADAFTQIPGPKSDEPAPAPVKKGISLKGKGADAKHLGRMSEPTMVMSADELAAARLNDAEEAPEPEPAPAPEPEPEPAAKKRETAVKRIAAREHLKKIQKDLGKEKDEAGTRYIPASTGLAKTRRAEPTMVITREQLRAVEATEEPPEAPPAEKTRPMPTAEAPDEPPADAPPPADEAPADKTKAMPTSEAPAEEPAPPEEKPVSLDELPDAPSPAACAHSQLMLLAAAGCAALAVVIAIGVRLLPVWIVSKAPWFFSMAGWGGLALTALAAVLAGLQAIKTR